VPERAEPRSIETEDASVAGAQPPVLAVSMPGAVLALQRSAGNRAVAALVARRAAVARDSDTCSADYKSKKTRQNLTLHQYKAAIGTKGAEQYAPAIKAASLWGGTKVSPVALSRPELGASSRPYAPFIGRGPIQVTWEAGYVQAIAYVEARGEQLEAEATALEATAPGSAAAPGCASWRRSRRRPRRRSRATSRRPPTRSSRRARCATCPRRCAGRRSRRRSTSARTGC
jgi:hypothetical protein